MSELGVGPSQPAGWYDEGGSNPGRRRWWNGTAWTVWIVDGGVVGRHEAPGAIEAPEPLPPAPMQPPATPAQPAQATAYKPWPIGPQPTPNGPACPGCGQVGTLTPRVKSITQKRRVKFGLLWVLITLFTAGLGIVLWLIWPRNDEVIAMDRYTQCNACGYTAH